MNKEDVLEMELYFVGKYDNCVPFSLVDEKGRMFCLETRNDESNVPDSVDYFNEGNWVAGKIVDSILLNYDFVSDDGQLTFTVTTEHLFRVKEPEKYVDWLRNKRK